MCGDGGYQGHSLEGRQFFPRFLLTINFCWEEFFLSLYKDLLFSSHLSWCILFLKDQPLRVTKLLQAKHVSFCSLFNAKVILIQSKNKLTLSKNLNAKRPSVYYFKK